jgi:hypothetical protein
MVSSMIQSLGDVLLLVTTVVVGVAGLLLSVFLYHIIFVVMDLRQVMKRVNDVTAEIEEVIMKPVEATAVAFAWIQKLLWDLLSDGSAKRKEKKKKHRHHKEKAADEGV